ncbi:hypothetical protein NQ318_000654 [Aromia moschata]|uniref:Reverse transcriptase domain-containing protein n=1 Tax=Aromia moschata TaxID=1265417 RepID=A0AAV8XNG4_9CUCU|nr:hypothetical protein NQ318_000654 [Aromia moschata]
MDHARRKRVRKGKAKDKHVNCTERQGGRQMVITGAAVPLASGSHKELSLLGFIKISTGPDCDCLVCEMCLVETVRKLKTIFGRNEAPSAPDIRRLLRKVRGRLMDNSSHLRARPVRTAERIAAVAQSVHENPRTSTHHRSQQLNVSRTSLRRILHKDLVLFPYKLQLTKEYNGEYFQQHEGMAMSNSLSPFIANLFMSKFETEVKDKFEYFPRVWFRYVDDIFASTSYRATNVTSGCEGTFCFYSYTSRFYCKQIHVSCIFLIYRIRQIGAGSDRCLMMPDPPDYQIRFSGLQSLNRLYRI